MSTGRLRLQRDVLFTQTEDGIVFYNASTAFEIRGKSAFVLFNAFAPHLRGDYTREELTEGLPATQVAMLDSILEPLLARGLLKESSLAATDRASSDAVDQFASQVAYVDHFAPSDALDRFNVFSTAAMAVIGDGAAAEACLRALVDNGARNITAIRMNSTDEGQRSLRPSRSSSSAPNTNIRLVSLEDVGEPAVLVEKFRYIVVCPGQKSVGLLRDLCALDGPASGSEWRVLPIWFLPGQIAAGPFWGAGAGELKRRPNWLDAVRQIADAGAPEAAAALYRSLALDADLLQRQQATDVFEAMIGNLVAFEIFKAATGIVTPETSGHVVMQDLDTADTRVARVLPTVDDVESEGSSAQTSDDSDEYARWSALLDSVTGPLLDFDDDVLEQSPIKSSSIRYVSNWRPLKTFGFSLDSTREARVDALRRGAAAKAVDLIREHSRSASRSAVQPPIPFDGAEWPFELVPLGGTDYADRSLELDDEPNSLWTGIGADFERSEALRAALRESIALSAMREVLSSQRRLAPIDWHEVLQLAGSEQSADAEFLRTISRALSIKLEVHTLHTADEYGLETVVGVVRAEDSNDAQLWELHSAQTLDKAATACLTRLLGLWVVGPQRTSPFAPAGARAVIDIDSLLAASVDVGHASRRGCGRRRVFVSESTPAPYAALGLHVFGALFES